MIAHSLKVEIETYADRTLRTNRLLRMAESGQVTPKTLAAYLFNVRYLIRHTPPYLARARVRAQARGWSALAEFYAGKGVDEHGHDAWAESDIANVQTAFSVELPDEPSRAIVELVAYLRDTIDEHPQRYLAYILFAEYFTVLAGPTWIHALQLKCGVPASWVSSIGNHAELDKVHVDEALSEIDALVRDPRELPGLTETLRRSIDCFERFCDELSGAIN
jgi:hypothetical protein